MKYAKKIDVKFDLVVDNFNRHPVVGRHGLGVGEYQQERLIRRYVPQKQIEAICNLLPLDLHNKIKGVNLTEIRLLAPHVHLTDQCVMNFYQKTNNEVTSFWEGPLVRDDAWTRDNGNGYLNVDPGMLMFAESFQAEPGDVWLLNTLQPHSVSLAGDGRPGMQIYEPVTLKPRQLITVYFDAAFEEVAAYF